MTSNRIKYGPKGTIITIIRPVNGEKINPLKHIRFDEAEITNLAEVDLMTDRHRWKMVCDKLSKSYVSQYHDKVRMFRFDTGVANASTDYSYIQAGAPYKLSASEKDSFKKEIYNIIKKNKFKTETSKDSVPDYVLDNAYLREVSRMILNAYKRNFK